MKFNYDRKRLGDASRKLSARIDQRQGEIVKDLCRLAGIDTVNSGMIRGRIVCNNKLKIFRAVEKMADTFGLKYFRIGQRGLVVEWGKGRRVITVPLHLDVVHAGSDWTYPPFAGTVHRGKIYGRGTSDNKGPCVSALHALAAVKETGYPLMKKIRLVYSADEEAGVWMDMRACLKKLGPSEFAIVQDSLFPVVNAEKGFLDIVVDVPVREKTGETGLILRHFSGGLRSNMVPDRASAVVKTATRMTALVSMYNRKSGSKIRILSGPEKKKRNIGNSEDIVFEALGRSAHGSRPGEGRNAVIDLAGFLQQLPLARDGRTLVARFFHQKIGKDFWGLALGIAITHPKMGKLTVNLGHVIDSGKSIRFILNIRYPVGINEKKICDTIARILPFSHKISVGQNSLKPFWISPKDPHIRELAKAFEISTGEKAGCVAMAGTTYAKLFRKAAGFGPLLPHEPGRAHMPDEYLPVKSLVRNTKALAAAYLALGGA